MSLSLDHRLTSVCKRVGQWRTTHYLARPTEILKCLKISASDFGTVDMRRRKRAFADTFLDTVPEVVVHIFCKRL